MELCGVRMYAAPVFRFFKKKLVLAVIFSMSLIYCITTLLMEENDVSGNMEGVSVRGPIVWASGDNINGSNTGAQNPTSCRNSVQGKDLITDDRGYVCSRGQVLLSGCCDTAVNRVRRHACDTCSHDGCCQVFEYCISCCLHPDKKSVLQTILGSASGRVNVVFSSVTDHWELCLAKCRTSSQSVQHENMYRNPRAKHCYGDVASPSQPNG